MSDPDATAPAAPPHGASRVIPPVAATGTAANPDAPVPIVFGEIIARGGMGAILRARDCKLPRTMAAKIILAGAEADETQRQRFVNEAAVLAQLAHPNIVPVYDIGRDAEGQLYYTMKLVKGRTLQSILNDLGDRITATVERYTLNALLTIFRKVCDAIAFAHSRGIIHRDLKPENIMVGEFGEVLVMDWGLAKVLSASEDLVATSIQTGARSGGATMPPSASLPSLTLEGSIMGTPQYMSPEQAKGDIAGMGPASDIWSLGGILYAILTLRPPVEGRTLEEALQKVSRGQITPLEQGTTALPSRTGRQECRRSLKIPPALSAVTMKALSLKREDRYPSAIDLGAEIEKYQNGFATGAERAGLARQIVLLVGRHKGAFATAAAAWLIITALAVWFVINVTRERNRATANEWKAEQNARIAQSNEQRAVENEKRAVAGEQEAVAEKEKVRRALAKSALALAEAAYREADGSAMQAALDQVPADLRDANWSYLLEQSDTSITRVPLTIRGLAAHPKLAGVFAVVGTKPEILLLNARTGERLLRIPISFEGIQSRTGFALAFSPDGERIAVGMNNASGGISIHDARDGGRLKSWNTKRATRLEFSADGRHLLQITYGLAVTLWNAIDGKLVWEKPARARDLRAAILPDGTHVLARSEMGGSVALLKVGDGNVARVFENTKSASAFALRPDGVAFAIGFADGSVRSIELKDGRTLFSVRAHLGPVKEVVFTPDSDRLISIAKQPDGRQSIVALSAATGATVQTFVGGMGDVSGVTLHPLSGELLISGDVSRLWEVVGAEPRWVQTMASQTGSPVASAVFLDSDDRFLGVWKNVARMALVDLSAQTIQKLPSDSASQMQTVSANGRLFASAILGASAGRVEVVKNEDGIFSKVNEIGFAGGLQALQLSPKGDRLALVTSGNARLAAIFDATSGAHLLSLEDKQLPAIDLRWTTDGKELLALATAKKKRGVAGSEERIIIWDAATGKQVRSVVHPTALDCLVIAPDGKRFAAAGADKLVHVFDTETLEERQNFRAHDGPITALAWHPSRPIVATGSADLTIKLWNLESGRRLETLRGPTAAPRVLNFSPSGQRLACASEDRMVRIWEPKPLQNAVLDAPAADGWEDLLAKLKADEVKANGNGWMLSGGVLVSGEKEVAALPLAGNFARSSYTVRVSLRRVGEAKGFAVILPVADQQVAFDLDAAPKRGFFTGLSMLDGKIVFEQSDTVRGQQVKDTEPHELEITVRPSARTAQIVATLDGQPLYQRSPALSALKMVAGWNSPAQPTLHLGASSADWVISAVRVKRL